MGYIVKQIDFDNWENHSPLYESIIGSFDTRSSAEKLVAERKQIEKPYKGWDNQEYPKFEIIKVKDSNENLKGKLKRWLDLLSQDGKNTKLQVKNEIKAVLEELGNAEKNK